MGKETVSLPVPSAEATAKPDMVSRVWSMTWVLNTSTAVAPSE